MEQSFSSLVVSLGGMLIVILLLGATAWSLYRSGKKRADKEELREKDAKVVGKIPEKEEEFGRWIDNLVNVAVERAVAKATASKTNETAVAIILAAIAGLVSVGVMVWNNKLTTDRELKMKVVEKKAEVYQGIMKSWVDAVMAFNSNPLNFEPIVQGLKAMHGKSEHDAYAGLLNVLIAHPGVTELVEGHGKSAPGVVMWTDPGIVHQYAELRQGLFGELFENLLPNGKFSEDYTEKCKAFVKAMRDDVGLSNTSVDSTDPERFDRDIIGVFGSLRRHINEDSIRKVEAAMRAKALQSEGYLSPQGHGETVREAPGRSDNPSEPGITALTTSSETEDE